MEEERWLSQEERRARGEVIRKLWDIGHMEEVMWRQKSVAKDGDKNIKFFHQMADVRRRINFIGRI